MDELDKLSENSNEDKNNLSSSSKESEPENLEAIKKFIADHDKTELAKNAEPQESSQVQESAEGMETEESTNYSNLAGSKEETLAIASSVMDMILTESTSKIKSKKSEIISTPPAMLHSDKCEDKGSSSVALSVGSKVEARDFAETWYAAEIVEVDYDEMEVLVRYESIYKKPEEWICVNSPRLRPVTETKVAETFMKKAKVKTPEDIPPEVVPSVREEEKVEEKSKAMFAVGERCLARWRDNRRFTATVQSDLGNGTYEIIFDDGFNWKCSTSRLSKLKGLSKPDCTSTPRASSSPSPTADIGPSTSATSPVPYHTHLFDPTRDYLGSKSERRELKRKLNIKEIFNIGQKQRKKEATVKDKPKVPRVKKPRIERRKPKIELKSDIKIEKKEIPDAIASIIGTVTNKDAENVAIKEEICEDMVEIKKEESDTKEQKIHTEEDEKVDTEKCNDEISQPADTKSDDQDEKLNNQESPTNDNENINKNDNEREKDVILTDEDTQSAKMSDGEFDFDDGDVTVPVDPDEKLSDDLDAKNNSDPIQEEETKLQNFEMPDDMKHEEVMDRIKEAITKLEDGLKEELNAEIKAEAEKQSEIKEEKCEPEVKMKISTKESRKCLKLKKKLKLLKQERAEEIGKLNSKLEQMRMEIDEMKMKKLRAEALEHLNFKQEMPESALPAEEWCCKWVNGEPVGTVIEVDSECKLDVVNNKLALPRKIVEVHDKRLPEGWKKLMVRRSLGHSAGKWDVVLVSPDKKRYHTKTEMRNYLETTQDPALKPYESALLDFAVHLKLSRRMGWVVEDRSHTLGSHPRSLDSNPLAHKRKKLRLKDNPKDRRAKKRKLNAEGRYKMNRYRPVHGTCDKSLMDSSVNMAYDNSTLEDGYVYVGSFKVQVIDNLLRCPAEGCFKNFRNNTLLQMHIKHYHRDMCKMLGATPKVLDLAYARTVPTEIETKPRHEPDNKIIKVKLPKPMKRLDEPKLELRDIPVETKADSNLILPRPEKIPRSLDSPMMRAQMNRPVKRPKVLLPVRRPDPVEPPPEFVVEEIPQFTFDSSQDPGTSNSIPPMEVLDFETAISTHTVTKPIDDIRKKRKVFATISKAPLSEDEDTLDMNSDVETRSSFPGSGTPDSKTTEVKSVVQNLPISSESNEDSTMYMYTETGERIKLERMKREEIINCHCGFREEDGLMVQCELCLCWQHALCHNIQREADVPQKYTCYICLNPRRGRRSQRFLHDQDRLYEGLLPGAKPCETLRRSHDISANLLKIADALHALRVLYHVATKKNHPKLYLWAKDWEEPGVSQPDAPAGPTALPDLVVNKENVPVCGEERLGALLGGLLAGHAGTSAEMPVCSAAMDGLDHGAVRAPQPEPMIENGACRERLLRYVQRCLALMDGRVDAVESEIVELESQQPSFEDDETADYFPRTKQTINMLMRDLDTLQQLGVIT